MGRYIPFQQMQQLREAAKNGDERAIKILRCQLEDKEDFSADLEDYFKSAIEEENKVEEVAEQPQEMAKQEETLEMQPNKPEMEGAVVPTITGKPQESDNEISGSILALISACDKKTIDVANDSEISDATKKGALSILQEIKQSCLENLEKFGKLMSSISKKIVEDEE